MPRTQLSSKRQTEIKEINIGRIIIFCEGKTEKYYFDYFAEIIKKRNYKYNDIEVVVESANGNAQAVLDYANHFLSDEMNRHKFSTYGKYLVFDCDAPPNIQTVITNAKEYELLITNYLFETWLLMHFENISSKIPKRDIYRRLRSHLGSRYSKGQKGITRQIITTGNLEKAIDHAKELERKYSGEEKNIFSDILDMNPYTSVHSLIEQFMLNISK